MVDGPDGNVWFLSNGVQTLIGKISNSGVVTTYQTPANLTVGSITASPTNNSLWFTAAAYPEVQPNPIQIGRITTDGTITVDPAESSSIIGNGPITFGPGGNLWYLERPESTPENSGLSQSRCPEIKLHFQLEYGGHIIALREELPGDDLDASVCKPRLPSIIVIGSRSIIVTALTAKWG